jgi:hypothetical protein
MSTNQMAGFGYKTGWLAIQDGDLPTVLDLLEARVMGVAAWQEGIDRAYNEADSVVATPLLTGTHGAWMLVAGRWVASNRDRIDVAAMSAALSREVQLFVTHRVVEGHGWERASGGTSARSFEYVGESGKVTRWHGDPQDIELAIGLPTTFDPTRDSMSEKPGLAVCEDDVMRVAAAWSVDPTTLEGLPATAPLTVAQLPLQADRYAEPQHEPMVVDITDLIISGESYQDVNTKIASRLRGRPRRWRRR